MSNNRETAVFIVATLLVGVLISWLAAVVVCIAYATFVVIRFLKL